MVENTLQRNLLGLYKKIYHDRVDPITINAFLLVLKRQYGYGWSELSRAFGVNNKEELLDYLISNIR